MTKYQFIRDLWHKQIFRQTDKTNFKLSSGNNITNCTTGKIKLFQQKENYENQSTCSKVTAEHP